MCQNKRQFAAQFGAAPRPGRLKSSKTTYNMTGRCDRGKKVRCCKHNKSCSSLQGYKLLTCVALQGYNNVRGLPQRKLPGMAQPWMPYAHSTRRLTALRSKSPSAVSRPAHACNAVLQLLHADILLLACKVIVLSQKQHAVAFLQQKREQHTTAAQHNTALIGPLPYTLRDASAKKKYACTAQCMPSCQVVVSCLCCCWRFALGSECMQHTGACMQSCDVPLLISNSCNKQSRSSV